MSGPSVTLCRLHAKQIIRLETPPTDGCDPAAWLNGRGEMIECDVVAAPTKVAGLLDRKGITDPPAEEEA